MSQLTITVKRFDRLKEFPEIAGPAFNDTMTVGVERWIGDAQVNSPVDRGFFRSSLDGQVDQISPLQIVGRVFASAQHAPIIEGVDEQGNETQFGRRPGGYTMLRDKGRVLKVIAVGTKFPPVGAVRAWVQRVLGVSGEKQIARVAFAVSLKIVREGIRPRRPLGTALRSNAAFLQRIFDDAANRIARQLEGAR